MNGCPLCGAESAPRQQTIGIAAAVGRRSPVEAVRTLLRAAHPQGLTAAELTTALRLSSTTITARLFELRRRNEVKRIGERRNASGRMAAVVAWVPPAERNENHVTPESMAAVVGAVVGEVSP